MPLGRRECHPGRESADAQDFGAYSRGPDRTVSRRCAPTPRDAVASKRRRPSASTARNCGTPCRTQSSRRAGPGAEWSSARCEPASWHAQAPAVSRQRAGVRHDRRTRRVGGAGAAGVLGRQQGVAGRTQGRGARRSPPPGCSSAGTQAPGKSRGRAIRAPRRPSGCRGTARFGPGGRPTPRCIRRWRRRSRRRRCGPRSPSWRCRRCRSRRPIRRRSCCRSPRCRRMTGPVGVRGALFAPHVDSASVVEQPVRPQDAVVDDAVAVHDAAQVVGWGRTGRRCRARRRPGCARSWSARWRCPRCRRPRGTPRRCGGSSCR